MTTRDAGSREVIGRGSIYTAAVVAPMLANVLVLPLVTRRLSVDQYASVAVALSLLQLGVIVCTAGLTISVTRQTILGVSGAAGARGTAVASAGVAAALGAVLVGLEPWWSALLSTASSDRSLMTAIICAVAGAAVAAVQAYLRARDRAAQFVMLSAFMSLGGPALGLLLIRADPRAETYLSGLLIAYVVAAIIGFWIMLRDGAPNFQRAELRDAFKTGLPTLPHQMALSLMTGAMILVASTRLDHGSAARLQLLIVIGTVPTVVVSAMNNAWVPLILRARPENRISLLERTARHVSLLAAIAGAVMGLAGPWLLAFLAPDSYSVPDAGRLIAAFAVSAPLSAIYLASSHLVFASGRTSWLAVTTPLSMTIGAALAAVSAPRFGLAAVALGFGVAYVLLASLTYAVASHEYRPRWNILSTWPAAAAALTGLGMGVMLPSQGVAWTGARIVGIAMGTLLALRLLTVIYAESRTEP